MSFEQLFISSTSGTVITPSIPRGRRQAQEGGVKKVEDSVKAAVWAVMVIVILVILVILLILVIRKVILGCYPQVDTQITPVLKK